MPTHGSEWWIKVIFRYYHIWQYIYSNAWARGLIHLEQTRLRRYIAPTLFLSHWVFCFNALSRELFDLIICYPHLLDIISISDVSDDHQFYTCFLLAWGIFTFSTSLRSSFSGIYIVLITLIFRPRLFYFLQFVTTKNIILF